MRCRYERSERGHAAIQRVQNIRSRNISVCCGLLKTSVLYYKRQNRAFNTETFLEFIDDTVAKLAEMNMSNMMFIMDNVAFHKSHLVAEKITASGHTIHFLPSYSPFLNPIENMFSEVKQRVRVARPHNEEQLFTSFDSSFNAVVSNSCENYYRHMLSFIPKCLNREIIDDENYN